MRKIRREVGNWGGESSRGVLGGWYGWRLVEAASEGGSVVRSVYVVLGEFIVSSSLVSGSGSRGVSSSEWVLTLGVASVFLEDVVG